MSNFAFEAPVTDLFGPVADQVESEQRTYLALLSEQAVEPVWSYLSKASSLAEFEDRLALAESNIDSVLSNAEATSMREHAVEHLRQRFATRKVAWIDEARAVVADSTAQEVDGMLLDLFTASMLVQIIDGLNPANSAKFAAMPLASAVDMGWKLADRAKGAAKTVEASAQTCEWDTGSVSDNRSLCDNPATHVLTYHNGSYHGLKVAVCDKHLAAARNRFSPIDSDTKIAVKTATDKTSETHPPYYVKSDGGKYKVVNDNDDVKGTFDTHDEAREQQKALYSQVPGAAEKAKEKHEGAKTAGPAEYTWYEFTNKHTGQKVYLLNNAMASGQVYAYAANSPDGQHYVLVEGGVDGRDGTSFDPENWTNTGKEAIASRAAASKTAAGQISDHTQRFVDGLNAKHGNEPGAPWANYNEFEAMPGGKFDRVVVHHPGPDGNRPEYSGSAHAFVNRETGQVHKADGWKRPTKDARYPDVDSALASSDPTGRYLYKGGSLGAARDALAEVTSGSVRQVVYKGPSFDKEFSDDGPAIEDIQPLIGKFLSVTFYNDSGVAADIEMGRIIEVERVRGVEVQIEWQLCGPDGQPVRESYPINGSDIFKIERVEEPNEMGQQGLFASRTAAAPEWPGVEKNDDFNRSMYDWGYEHGKAGNEDATPTERDMTKPFPAGYYDGLEGRPHAYEKKSSRTALPKDSLADTIAWVRQNAEKAGSSSVSRVSGSDVNRVLDAISDEDDENVKWARRQAEKAGTASVSRLSGTDLLALCDMASRKTSSKTASSVITWRGDNHMGVSFVSGTSPIGVYECYYNPNMDPTPCSWVFYGPEGDTGPHSGVRAGRGFTTLPDAMKAAEADAAAQVMSSTASKAAAWDQETYNNPEYDKGYSLGAKHQAGGKGHNLPFGKHVHFVRGYRDGYDGVQKGASLTPLQMARQALNDAAFGTERYQPQPELPAHEWIHDEWDEGKADQETLDEGRAGHTPENPFTDSLTTTRDTRTGGRHAQIYDAPVNHPSTSKPRAKPSGGGSKPDLVTVNQDIIPADPVPQQPVQPAQQPAAAPVQQTAPPTSAQPVDPTQPTAEQAMAAKVARMTQKVMADEPGLTKRQAHEVAVAVIDAYPEMVKGTN